MINAAVVYPGARAGPRAATRQSSVSRYERPGRREAAWREFYGELTCPLTGRRFTVSFDEEANGFLHLLAHSLRRRMDGWRRRLLCTRRPIVGVLLANRFDALSDEELMTRVRTQPVEGIIDL